MIFFDVVVRVPLQVARASARNHTNKSHSILDQSSREQTAPPVVVSRFRSDAVKIERLLGFARKVENLGRFGLHFEGQIIRIDARAEFVVARLQAGLVQIANKFKRAAALLERDALGERQVEHRTVARAKDGSAENSQAESHWRTSVGRLPERL